MLTFPQKQSPDVAPAAPPPRGRATVVIAGPDGQLTTISIPRTRAEIAALISQRQAISDQLENVSDRRRGLAEELAGTPDEVARKGLEDRIQVLDHRILQLESDLDATSRQIAAAPANIVATTEAGMSPPNTDDATYQGMLMGGLGVLGVCAVVFFSNRRRWRRRATANPSGMSSDSAQRLERLEQGMEAIAIEIERISEGQRFVTKLLSQSDQAAQSAVDSVKPAAIEKQSIKA